LRGKWFLGIVFVLGSTVAIGILVFLSIVREQSGMSATPAPTSCVRQEGARITCTLSASTTRVKAGEIVSLTMAISNPIGSCVDIAFITYSLTQSPLLFTSAYHGFIEYNLDEQLLPKDAVGSSRETFDLKAVQPGHGAITGRVDFEVLNINTGIWVFSHCDAGEVDILVEP